MGHLPTTEWYVFIEIDEIYESRISLSKKYRLESTASQEIEQESLADAKVSARQQCVYEGS